jgi:phospholipid transport system substrate-binding protein
MSLTRRSVVAVIGTILAFAMGPEPAGAEGHSAPADFLRSLTESAAEKLGDANVGQDEKEAAFRGLFREAFDVPGISRFVLGKHWTRVRRFLPLFAEFSKDMISIGRFKEEKNNPGYYLVGSTIQRPNETPIAVIWRLRDNDGDFVVMDVIAEGVSMAISLRHEYGEVVQNHGIDGLIARLKEKNARLSAE